MSNNYYIRQSRYLLLMGISVVLLMIVLVWSFRVENVIAGTFKLNEIVVCEELDDEMRPLMSLESLSPGAAQACLWFSYSRAREGDTIDVVWEYDGMTIQKDSFRLSDSRGMKAYYLFRDDGAPLNPGDYAVTIWCNSRKKAVKPFDVPAVSDDIAEDETDTEVIDNIP